MPGIQSILIPAPEAEPLVGPFRRTGDWSSGHGIPAHITIAGPWSLTTRLPVDALRQIRAAMDGERYTLSAIGTLGDAICLFPDADDTLLRWRARILTAVGTTDDNSEDWRVHLTVSRGQSQAAARAIEASLTTALPLHCEVKDLILAQLHSGPRVTLRTL